MVVLCLTVSSLLRVSTYYADNEYDTNKPYVFTIDKDGCVTHITWKVVGSDQTPRDLKFSERGLLAPCAFRANHRSSDIQF